MISTLPAGALAALPIAGVPGAGRLGLLRPIEHPAVVSVFTGFKRDAVDHPLDGFGVLMPQVEHGLILGTLFSSTMFPGRAPDGQVALTSFVGGIRDPDFAALDEAALWHLVQTELSRLLGVRELPVFTRVHRWPRAIPQYTLGYEHYQAAIAAVEAAAPGLFIGDNCRDGISLANCVAAGARLARAVRSHLTAAPNQGNKRSSVQPEPASV